MASLKNAIKKAEKVSGEKIKTNSNNLHWVSYKGYSVQFYPNGRIEENVSATNFYTIKNTTPDTYNDRMTDYFNGTFHDNVAQCFSFIDRMTKAN